jgi:hypothetical protein
MEAEQIDIGDKVRHPKFGQGTVMSKSGEGDSFKVVVKFPADVGEKKLVAKYAKLKKIDDRPTLAPEAATAGAAAPTGLVGTPEAAAAADEDEEDDEDEEAEEGDEEEEEDEK